MTETPGEKAAREERSRAAQIANIAHEPGVRQQL
jgi:hypothetical protein